MGEGSETKRTKLTNESNEKVAQMNIDYAKEYNQQIFHREDTANQRAVEDMRKAGLNPLANYAPSASGGTAVAPQSNMHYETGESKLMENLRVLETGLNIANQFQQQGLGLQQMQQNNASLEAQKIANDYANRTFEDRYIANKYANFNSQLAFKRAHRDYEYRNYYGIYDGDDLDTIRAKIIARNFIDYNDDYSLSYANGAYSDSLGHYQSHTEFDRELDDNLQNFSAIYGEISDKVLDTAKDLIKSKLGASKNSKVTNNHSITNDYGTKNINSNRYYGGH